MITYSSHPPFLLAVLACRLLRGNLRLCLILPDLPDFMGVSSGFQGLLNRLYVKSFYVLVKRFDCYALLSSQMIERMGVDETRCIIVEGISQGREDCTTLQPEPNAPRAILYTGTLAAKYGVRNLLDAFVRINDENVTLWICGDGDSREYVKNLADRDSRIRYFGQVDRLESLRLQRLATVLVNPRLPAEEYTKYSFPSKVMEYMSSGRPVIMYRLDGIPNEYFKHCIVPDDWSIEKLSVCIQSVLRMSDEERNNFADGARRFVRDRKNPEVQAGRLINLISSVGK